MFMLLIFHQQSSTNVLTRPCWCIGNIGASHQRPAASSALAQGSTPWHGNKLIFLFLQPNLDFSLLDTRSFVIFWLFTLRNAQRQSGLKVSQTPPREKRGVVLLCALRTLSGSISRRNVISFVGPLKQRPLLEDASRTADDL